MINSSLSGILQDAIGQEQCRQVLLVSRVGTMVAGAGKDTHNFSQSLGPIVASTFGRGAELGRLLGVGDQDFQIQRGHRQDLILCQMSNGMIVAATFPVQVDEERAAAFARQLINQIEALIPSFDPYSDRPLLTPELRDEAIRLVDQIFAATA
jgi:predicted regulator of Ras-like GTPase activity (Roadblock/LC7/MglB family)